MKCSRTRLIVVVTAIVAAVAAFLMLALAVPFKLYSLEQNQLFLWDRHYILSTICSVGGISRLLSDFLLGFFAVKYAGAAISAVLLSLLVLFSGKAVGRCGAPDGCIPPLALVPAIAVLAVLLDPALHWDEVISLVAAFAAFAGYVSIENYKTRCAAGTLLFPLLWLATGAEGLLFTICVLLYEFLKGNFSWPTAIQPVVTAAVLFAGVRLSWVPDPRWDLGPLSHYEWHGELSLGQLMPWISLPMSMVLAALTTLLRRKGVKIAFATVLYGAVLLYGVFTAVAICRTDQSFEELDWHLKARDWDGVIASYEKYSRSPDIKVINDVFLNIALAEKGELCEKMFNYEQHGLSSLYFNYGRNVRAASLMNELYYSAGAVALSARMAFEANVNAYGHLNPRMTQRLVQTNIILGSYEVAEKYIKLLEKSIFYRKWATSQRQFLGDDERVAGDSEYGAKRLCTDGANYLGETEGFDNDLMEILRNNPSHTISADYLMAMYLLERDMDGLALALDEFYGTEALATLPKAVQEAVIITSEVKPGYMEQFEIDRRIFSRYLKLRREAGDLYSNDQQILYKLTANYMDTFWLYAMFADNDE
ncbi:MAG: hypothetical protein HUJ91_02530 [Bacteroidales bacterium]|nr:hypothetical protein [Bacteroidales bacterium]